MNILYKRKYRYTTSPHRIFQNNVYTLTTQTVHKGFLDLVPPKILESMTKIDRVMCSEVGYDLLDTIERLVDTL